MTMKLYIVQFYDANESGNVEHNELYTTLKSARRRYASLAAKLNCYSWVSLYKTVSVFGRVRCGCVLDMCRSCKGNDDYYHGNDSDF